MKLLWEQDDDDRRLTIQEKFERFDAAYPEVYKLFKQFVAELQNAGRTHYSSDAILHRIRLSRLPSFRS